MSGAHHPDAVTVNTRGAHRRGEAYLGTWRFRRDDKFSPFWQRANDGAGVAREYFARLETIASDRDLNDAAKARRTRELAGAFIGQLGREQHRLNEAAGALRKERQALAAVAPYGGPDAAAQAVLDAAICQLVRAMPQAEREKLLPRLISGEDPRTIEAVLRAPSILSGLSDPMRSTIETAAIRRQHPEAVMLQESLEEAAGFAQHVLKGAAALVIEASGLSELEALGALGDDWRGLVQPLGGSEEVTDSLAKRYADGAAS